MNVQQLFADGKLSEAIALVTDRVRQKPLEADARGLLAELLCFTGQWERVDKQLETLLQQHPDATLGIAMWRQVLRGEMARQQFYSEGRLPEFTAPPEAAVRASLEASILLREGRAAEAQQLLAGVAPRALQGACNGQAFAGLMDLDELLAPVCEVLTTTGKYYWIDWAAVERIEFRPPKRPRDLIWRRAHMVVRGGPDGEVYLPSLYAGSAEAADDRVKLGQMTDWTDGTAAPLRGLGQRMIRAGERDLAWMELNEITVAESAT
jgi:type VI secretion system protein ImpE